LRTDAAGTPQPRRYHQKNFFGSNPVMAIIYVNIVFFIFSIFLDPKGIWGNGGTFNFLSPSEQVLFLLGATGTIPVWEAHRFWTLISASYLHGGILHIALNMMALYQLGPFVLKEFGFHRFINLYVLTGAVGFAVSVFLAYLLRLALQPVSVDSLGPSSTTVKLAAILMEKQFISRPWDGSSA